MRTTIEMKPEHRSKLLSIAARRGRKGFSDVVAEAIEVYLNGDAERAAKRKRMAALLGSLSDKDAAAMREEVARIRRNWR